MKLINRTSYMDTLTSLIGVPDIKVITGIRRSGKSKLLEALRDYVELRGGKSVQFECHPYQLQPR